MRTIAFAALLFAIPCVASAQKTPPPNEPTVQVGLFGYRADGSVGGSAHDTAPDLTSIVYVNGPRCLMGAGDRPAPSDATDVWQFAGKVVSSTPEQAVVQLQWRRTVANGLRIDGGESSQQLTLRFGEPVQLDQAAVDGKPGCPTVAVGFEARYALRFAGMGGGGGSGSGSGAGAGRGGVSARVVVGAGVGSGAGGGTGMSGSSATAGPDLFDVNLWLVRSVPGQPDEVTHSTLRMNQDGASFAFPPVAIATAQGSAMVQVTGSFVVTKSDSGEEQLVFATSRRVTTTTTGQPRDRFRGAQGISRTTNPLPGPDDVLAFEMPLIRLDGREAPDKFSVRVNLKRRQASGSPDQ